MIGDLAIPADGNLVPAGASPDLGEWSCMVCKAWRPDRFISVAKRLAPVQWEDAATEKRMGGPIIVNVRYCNDNQFCLTHATAAGPWHGSSVVDGEVLDANAVDHKAIPQQ